MKLSRKVVSAFVFAAAFAVQSTQAITPPLAANGQLKVSGTKLCNEKGDTIQLRGLDMHGIQWYYQLYDNGMAISEAAKSWGADFLRLTMYIYEKGYLDNDSLKPADFRTKIDKYVDNCEKAGIYAIIDWHVHHPGDPNYAIDSAKAFFKYMAQKHGSQKNVIYELCNEPNGDGLLATENKAGIVVPGHYVTWAEIKTYANTIIPIIRASAPNALILVGTPSWSTLGISSGKDWHEIADNKLADPNVMYVFHFYAAAHNFYPTIADAAKVLPLFSTEWASSGFEDNSQNDFVQGQNWIDMMAANKISWGYWNFATGKSIMNMFDTTTTAIGPFGPNGANVNATGKKVFSWLTVPADTWKDSVIDTGTVKTGMFTLVEDGEQGGNKNALGGYWYTYNDSSNGGKSTVLPKASSFTMTTGGCNSSKCVGITYTINKGALTYPGFVGVGTSLSPIANTTVDLSKATSIGFYFKGNACTFRLETSDITGGYPLQAKAIDASLAWKHVTVPLSDLHQENGGPLPLNAALALKLSWQAQSADGSGSISIDSITIEGINLLGAKTRSTLITLKPSEFQAGMRDGILTCGYSVAKSGHVTIGLYNAAGQRLMHVVNAEKSVGVYSSAVNVSQRKLTNQVYFVRFSANGKTITSPVRVLR